MNLHDMTVKDLIKMYLGDTLTDKFIEEMHEGHGQGLQGGAWRAHVERVVDKYKKKLDEKGLESQHFVGCFLF